MINFLCLTIIPTKNLLFCHLLKCIQFVKFNSSIKFSFFGSPRNERSTYINDFILQDQLKSFMYVERSLRGDPKKDKLIDELNFTNCMHLRKIQKIKFFVDITVKQIKFIVHPEFMVANNIFADQFIQNLKNNPNKVHKLPSEMKRSLKKQRLEKSIKLKIHKITRITDNNGKTEYHGRIYANNVVALELGCIRDNFEFREP